jgi:hypothetical protein
MTRAEFQQLIIDTIKGIPNIKRVYENFIPPPSKVDRFPAVAIDFPTTDFNRYAGKQFEVKDTIHLYVYTRSTTTNRYEDSINNVIELISKELTTNDTLNSNVIDIYVTTIKTDGGVSYPKIVNRLEVSSNYITECIN